MKRSITVPGTAKVSVEPDIASIRLGVQVMRDSAVAAREEAASTMSSVLDAVLDSGVERSDVQTSMVSLSAVMNYTAEGGPQVAGYQVTNTLSLTLRNLNEVGRVIDAALWAGASTLDLLEFRLEDPTEAQRAARVAAMDDARERAETIARAAGARIGAVATVTEGELAGQPMPRAARALALKAAQTETPIELGSQEIGVALTVTFELGGGK